MQRNTKYHTKFFGLSPHKILTQYNKVDEVSVVCWGWGVKFVKIFITVEQLTCRFFVISGKRKALDSRSEGKISINKQESRLNYH